MSLYTSLNLSLTFNPVYAVDSGRTWWHNVLSFNSPAMHDVPEYDVESGDFRHGAVGNPTRLPEFRARPHEVDMYQGEYRNAFALVQEEAAKLHALKRAQMSSPHRPAQMPQVAQSATHIPDHLPPAHHSQATQEPAAERAFVFHLDASQCAAVDEPWCQRATLAEDAPAGVSSYIQPPHWQHVVSPRPVRTHDKAIMDNLDRLAEIELNTMQAKTSGHGAARSCAGFPPDMVASNSENSSSSSNIIATPEWPSGNALPEDCVRAEGVVQSAREDLPKTFTWPGLVLDEENLQDSTETGQMEEHVCMLERVPCAAQSSAQAQDLALAGSSYQTPIDLTCGKDGVAVEGPAAKDGADPLRSPSPMVEASSSLYGDWAAVRAWCSYTERALSE